MASHHLIALMRLPSFDIESAVANFHRPAQFQRRPNLTKMRDQVAEIARLLRQYGVTVTFRYDGGECPDGTFTFDHAAVFHVAGLLYAFVPTANWERHAELRLSLPWIERFATVKKLTIYQGQECRFDAGTIVQAPNGVLIGYSLHKDARTNLAGANALKAELEELGYEGKIVLVKYSGLHLSTFCTCISTSLRPEPVFLAAASQVDVSAISQLGEVILVKDEEAWRANTIAHPAMEAVLLMKKYLPGEDTLLQTLLDRGYKVEVVELTESPCVQGSLFCHVLMFQALLRKK